MPEAAADDGPGRDGPGRIAGLVLAGGRSRRFGIDKALADFRGRPLIAWSLDALRPHAALLGVGGPAALGAQLGVAAVPDPPGAPDGPLAGVIAGLAWADRHGCALLATVPCDTPFLPPDLLPGLAAALGDRPVVAARAARVHALCALWRADVAPALTALLREGKQLSMQALIDALGGGYCDFDDEGAFANLNTPQQLAAAEPRPLDGGGGGGVSAALKEGVVSPPAPRGAFAALELPPQPHPSPSRARAR